jgi:hypothetical protein
LGCSPSSPPEAFWHKSSKGEQEKKEHSDMNDLIYVLLSLGLFAGFAVAIFGYERVE